MSAPGAGLTVLEAMVLKAAGTYYINRGLHRRMVGYMGALIREGYNGHDHDEV
jgi:hypothetical protein